MEENSRIGMKEAAGAARNVAEASDELTVVTLRRGDVAVETRVCTEENVMDMLGRFVEEVRDPRSDMILACAYRRTKAGLDVTQECLGSAWKESDKAALGRFRRATSGRNLAEDEDEPEAAYLYYEREDGTMARVELRGEDVWGAVETAYPRSWDLMAEDRVVDVCEDPARYRWDDKFRPGEDEELAKWLEGSE